MVRCYLRRDSIEPGGGIGVVIPRRKDERRRGPFDKAAYRQRNVVERLIAWLKQFRRVATRYEKRAANYRWANRRGDPMLPALARTPPHPGRHGLARTSHGGSRRRAGSHGGRVPTSRAVHSWRPNLRAGDVLRDG